MLDIESGAIADDAPETAAPSSAEAPKILYFAHNLHDAAVRRRVAMFEANGAQVTVAGFRRAGAAPHMIGSAPVIDLGPTTDGQLLQRAGSVLRLCLAPGALAQHAKQADILFARNLETLVIARKLVRPGQRLVHECLDIHRLMLGQGWKTKLLHRLEDWALARTNLLVVSAPLFLSEYFKKRRGWHGPALLCENKVPQGAAPMPIPQRPAAGAPWVIGWFGMLRCKRSLAMLRDIANRAAGKIQAVIAGIPSEAEFGTGFAAELACDPHVRFVGPYQPADLPRLYGQVHFIWAIDYFEEGLNSAWLLPNRLYEGLAHGAVPVALADVATGRWLDQHGVGVTIRDPLQDLPRLIAGLGKAEYEALSKSVQALPAPAICQSDAESKADYHIITGAP